MDKIVVRNETRGTLLFAEGVFALDWKNRLRGLMGRKGLRAEEGMVIRPCEGIHTMWMRFPIDVVFLDVRDTVVRIFPNVAPFRLRFGGREADTVIEGPVGMIERSGTRVGDAIAVRPAEPLENRAPPGERRP